MSIDLWLKVLYGAPPDVKGAEKLVLITLADKTSDHTGEVIWRRGERPAAVIATAAAISQSSLARVFQRLAGLGLEVRIPKGYDGEGKPVFGHRGASSDYRLPEAVKGWTIVQPSATERVDDRPPFGVEKGGRSADKGWAAVHPSERERVDDCPPPIPSSLKSLAAREGIELPGDAAEAAAGLLAKFGPDVDEHQVIAAVVGAAARCAEQGSPIRTMVGFTRRWTPEDLNRKHASRRPLAPASNAKRCPNGHLIAADGACCAEHEVAS